MATNEIYCGIDDFWDQLVRECDFSEIKTPKERQEARKAKFNEILQRINISEKDSDILPFLKVVLCYRFIVENVYTCEISEKEFGHKSEIDYNEIADYLTPVIADLKHVALDDDSGLERQSEIFNGSRKGVNDCIVHTLVECCSKDTIRAFLECVASLRYNCTIKPIHKLDFFSRVINEYSLKRDYRSMAEYGEMMIDLFNKDKIYSSMSNQLQDFVSAINLTNKELDFAFKALGKGNLAYQALLKGSIEESEIKAFIAKLKQIKNSLLKTVEKTDDENKRISKFNKLLEFVANQPQKERSESRIEFCFSFAKALYKRYEKSNQISYGELAYYLSAVMGDIEYIAATDTYFYADYQNIYRIGDRDFISCIVEAIVEHMSDDDMKRFMNCIVSIKYNKKELSNIVNYFGCVIHKYTKEKNYKVAADYAKWYFPIYKEMESSCTQLGVDDFKKAVDAIHSDVDVVYKALNIKDAEHEAKMEDIRKRATETYREAMHREKAELYDLAERCRAHGDEAGYCGYMSALGDIGR